MESIRERQKRVREEAILEAAHALLSEQGYVAMTMDSLAIHSGVSKPTLYQHFPSKEDLAVRVIVRAISSAMDTAEALPQTGSALDRLERTLRHLLEHHYGAGFPNSADLTPHIHLNPEFHTQMMRFHAGMSRLISEAKAEGSISETASTTLIVQIIGGMFGCPEYSRLLQNGQCTARTLCDTLVTIFFNGIRVRRNETSHGPIDGAERAGACGATGGETE